MHSSDSDSDSGWNKGLIAAVSKKHKKKKITEQDRITEMKDCLDEGADINTVDANGNTVLHTAVKKGYRIMVEFLREAGARTDIPNRRGETALTLAESLGQKEIASILKEPSTSRTSDLSSDDSSLNSSLITRPNRKRTADDELGEQAKRHRRSTLTDVSQPDLDRSTTKEKTYAASGLKRSLHGTVYQLKHLMLILHRAWKMKYSFRLATEMDAAEKFDDVVLRYRDNKGHEVYRFVQAKHKQDETKMISASDLLDVKDGDFSLLKYFISWRKIKNNPDFGKDSPKNFILCTNIGVDLDSLKEKNINVSGIKEPDDFLMVTNRSRQPPRYKLLVENPSGLWDTLKSASDVHRLAKEFAERVCGSLDIQLTTDIIKSYHVALAEEVVNVREKKFSANFIDNNCLSDEATEFRKILFLNTKRLLSKRNLSESNIWKFLREASLKLSSTFGKKAQSAIKPEQTQSVKLPEDQIDDAEISRFLDEFILAVNQPNEVELGEMIKREIGIHGQLDLPDAGFVRDSFQSEILNWFKTKQGSFLQEKDADNFFNEMKGKLGSLKTMTLSLEYSKKLKQLGIQFNHENTELQNFIGRPNHTPNQVLEIISPEQTLLTALQVCQTLAQLPKCEGGDGFIFVRLETLLTPEIMKLVLPAFQWPRNNNLLVVDCESISAKKHLQTVWNTLWDIMAKDVHKNLIVLTKSGKDLGTECTLSRTTCRVNYTDHSFDKLTNDSRKKLLEKPVTKFQGHKNKMSLGKLLGICEFDNLSADELGDLSDIIDANALVDIIRSDQLEFGADLDEMDTLQQCYINRTIRQEIFIKESILEDKNIPDLIAISGTEALQGARLRIGENFSMRRNFLTDLFPDIGINGDSSGKSGKIGESQPMDNRPKNFTTLDSPEAEKQFNDLCAENVGRNIHWLQKRQERYIWKKSQGDIARLVQHRGASATDDCDDRTGATLLSEDQLIDYDKPVIISDTAGMGKSTMLTHLARRIKKKKPHMLVLKVDLNDHSTALSEVMKKESVNDLAIRTERAIQFLVKKLCSGETDLARKVFRRIIERKHKVALIFDGFDEISPTYEGPVIDLLQTFADYGIKKLLVATRPHTRATLETKLNTFSYVIQPFSKCDQERFFTKFWEAEFHIADERIKKYTRALTNKLADSIEDRRNKFTGNPLQAQLVAEIFGNSCKEFVDSEIDEPQFPEKIDLIYLYENFVRKKCEVFFKRKYGNSVKPAVIEDEQQRRESLIEKHERLALDTLFDKDEVTELLLASGRSPERAYPKIPVERDGIITQFIDGQPQFGHRTYAEYFAAKLFSDMLTLKKRRETELLGKIFVADILLAENFNTMRAFIDGLLPDEHVLQGEFWTFCLKKYRSKWKETIFHVAAAEGNGRILRLFLDCLYANTEDQRDLILVQDMIGRTAVHNAAYTGNIDIIKYLIQKGADTNCQTNKGETPLHLAAQEGKLDVVEHLHRNGADINWRTNDGLTPLHLAAHQGKLDVVQYSHRNGADINCQTNDGLIPLHLAAHQGKLDVVEYLHRNGAGINCQRNDGVTSLHLAAHQGKLDIVEYLHRNGADINCQTNDGVTPLQVAAQEGKLDVVEYLHTNVADINSQTNDGKTSLLLAAGNGKLDVVEYLHRNGADINSQGNDGKTPLLLAAGNGKLDVVEYLHRNGADINCQRNDGLTPLHLAAHQGKLDVVEYLHRNGDGINSQTHDGKTPLLLAAGNGKLDVVEYLHRNGADINSQTNDGKTPLLLAAGNGTLDLVVYLYRNGADISCQRNDGVTPLHIAAQDGKLDIVEYLHRNGAGINSQTHDGKTPLLLAAGNGTLDLVVYLYRNGADISCQRNDGVTPLHVAAQDGKLDIVEYLHRNGAGINSQTHDGKTPLLLAAGNGKLDVVEYLHRNGADINSQTNNGETPLLLAAGNGKLDVVEYLHRNGADIKCQRNDGVTTLHLAAHQGKLDVVEYLHTNGAEINCQKNDGVTPLHVAAQEGKLDVVEYLHRNGAGINCETTDDETPLLLAADNGKLDVVEYLHRNGADINCKRNDGVTPLHVAAQEGKLDVVEYLLRNEAGINCQTNDDETPLLLAAGNGKLDVVEYLHRNGADINCQRNDGVTPLHVAAQEGQLDVVEYLHKNGAGINRQTNDGKTPLLLAAGNGKLDVVEYLHRNGADINCQRNDGVTPLHLAAHQGKLDVVEYLNRNGADINSQTNDGETPLLLAAGNCKLDVVEYLHRNGADINCQTNDGEMPLHLAAGNCKLDVVEYLHRNGADINCQTNDGETPLLLAAGNGKLDVVKYLHRSGAGIYCQRNDGVTSLHLAAHQGKLDVVEYLHRNGADINRQTNDGETPLHVAAQEGKLAVVEYLHRNGSDINCQENDGETPLHVAAQEGQL